ncbi:MAG: hypothetical protein ACMUJM_24970 [bacterium]
MIDQWFTQDIRFQLTYGNRIIFLDPTGQCGFLLPLLTAPEYKILKTDSFLTEQWQTVKEELYLRHEIETAYKEDAVVIYVTREKSKLSFLFDYCFTHGFLDLSKPAEWLKQKLFAHTGLQVHMENPLLLTAAKLGIGKNLSWWKKILQNLEELFNIEEELLPFLDSPESYLKTKDADIRRLFEEKIFEILGEPYIAKPPQTLAEEVVKRLFDGLVSNEVPALLLKVYYRWADSENYKHSLTHYIASYKVDESCDPWKAHSDHCFQAIDSKALRELTAHYHNKTFVTDKLNKMKKRANSTKVKRFIPSWWQDLYTLYEFDNSSLTTCDSFNKVIEFYTGSFSKVDRAIRHLYTAFIQEEEIIRPLQEHYESLNNELLQRWFAYETEYKQDQQGYLVKLFKKAKPGIAVIVGDGIRYEIADAVATALPKHVSTEKQIMRAGIPSETEHNMSALYTENSESIPLHKDREKKLKGATDKSIKFLDLEALNYSVKRDLLVLTYKDIDDTSEKLQQGALKLFEEFEQVLKDKILLLIKMGYKEVHLVTDHGFVLTGLLDESDKIEPSVKGKKEVHERFIRCEDKQNNKDLIEFKEKYDGFNYVYVARNHRPFKSKGVYGYAHGGFTPQEVILPAFIFRKMKRSIPALHVSIINKSDLGTVTGDNFSIKLQAASSAQTLFPLKRRVKIMLFAGNKTISYSNILTMEAGETMALEFSLSGHSPVKAVLLDAESQEHIESVSIEKSNVRDTGGLL